MAALTLAACGSEANEAPLPATEVVALDASGSAPSAGAALLSPEDFALINRLTWGASPADVTLFKQLGREAWIESLLRPEADFRMPAEFARQFDALGNQSGSIDDVVVSLASQRTKTRLLARNDPERARAETQAWAATVANIRDRALERSLLRDLYSPDQLREQMTWFWFNHFNVHFQAGLFATMANDYEENVIRARAMGKFCPLLKATLMTPAMMQYLDNAKNVAGRFNENYARELMELHTLGVDSGYSQADVEALARILSGAGYELDPTAKLAKGSVREGLFAFNMARHDKGRKVLLGQTIRANGFGEIEEAVSILCHRPETARRISFLIAQYFVAAEPPETLVDTMTAQFTASDGDITAVLRTMIAAPEFAASLGRLFKDPNHYVLSALRMGYQDRTLVNPLFAARYFIQLGQPRFRLSSPDGYSLVADDWSGSGQLGSRFVAATELGSGMGRAFTQAGERAVSPTLPDYKSKVQRYGLYPVLSTETRSVLDDTTNMRDWNTLFLASPEFMRR